MSCSRELSKLPGLVGIFEFIAIWSEVRVGKEASNLQLVSEAQVVLLGTIAHESGVR